MSIKSPGDANVLLRSVPANLSESDIERIVKKYDFFDKVKNKNGDFKNDLVDNNNGTITDRSTGLMWQKAGTDWFLRHYEALEYIDSLNNGRFAGYNNWRLPTLEELLSLLENKEWISLYLDGVFDRLVNKCRSADTRGNGFYWYVNFDHGSIEAGGAYSGYNVKAVRSVTN